MATNSTTHQTVFEYVVEPFVLDEPLDCSICREPLLFTPKKPNSTLETSKTPATSSTAHVNPGETEVAEIPDSSPTVGDLDKSNTSMVDEDDSLDPEPAVRTPCGHIFGRTCLSGWLESSNSNLCPMCNQKAYHHLILHLKPPTRGQRLAFAITLEKLYGRKRVARMVRRRLMSAWTRTLMRETAIVREELKGWKTEVKYVGDETMYDDESDGIEGSDYDEAEAEWEGW